MRLLDRIDVFAGSLQQLGCSEQTIVVLSTWMVARGINRLHVISLEETISHSFMKT